MHEDHRRLQTPPRPCWRGSGHTRDDSMAQPSPWPLGASVGVSARDGERAERFPEHPRQRQNCPVNDNNAAPRTLCLPDSTCVRQEEHSLPPLPKSAAGFFEKHLVHVRWVDDMGVALAAFRLCVRQGTMARNNGKHGTMARNNGKEQWQGTNNLGAEGAVRRGNLCPPRTDLVDGDGHCRPAGGTQLVTCIEVRHGFPDEASRARAMGCGRALLGFLHPLHRAGERLHDRAMC